MSKDFIPSNNPDLLAWSANLAERLSADPAGYHVPADDASAFAALQASWAAAMSLALNPSTRTSSALAARQDAYVSMVAMARRLNRSIQASPGMTDSKRIELGLSVRGKWTRIGRPGVPPDVVVVAAHGRSIRIKLRCAESFKRRKPKGIARASVYLFDGEFAPADRRKWTLAGTTARTILDLDLGPSIEGGSPIWIAATWHNPRGQESTLSVPVMTYVSGAVGVSSLSMMGNASEMHALGSIRNRAA